MLTEVTAARTTRDIQPAQVRRDGVQLQPLLLYRRLKDTAIHDAKRTMAGLPTNVALLERVWIEQHTHDGMEGWKTSFQHCCQMLGEDAAEERHKALREIDRAWRKALIDWSRKLTQTRLEVIATMHAQENPAWSMRRAIQGELPLLEAH